VRVPSLEARDPVTARRLWETGELLSAVRYPADTAQTETASLHSAHA